MEFVDDALGHEDAVTTFRVRALSADEKDRIVTPGNVPEHFPSVPAQLRCGLVDPQSAAHEGRGRTVARECLVEDSAHRLVPIVDDDHLVPADVIAAGPLDVELATLLQEEARLTDREA